MLALVVCFYLWTMPRTAEGRVGGGQSYSGGSRSYGRGGGGGGGGGGGSGGGDLIFFLIRLSFRYPKLGIPALIVVLFILYKVNQSGASEGFHPRPPPSRDFGPVASLPPGMGSSVGLGDRLEQLREKDPNFSRPVFQDFVQLLYTRFQEVRGSQEWDSLRPYLGESLIQFWSRNQAAGQSGSSDAKGVRIHDVVIGSARICGVRTGREHDEIDVQFEANYRESPSPVSGSSSDPASTAWYVRETWTLQRDSGVLSQPPEKESSLGCPSCGAPVEVRSDGTCTYCDEPVTRGALRWRAVRIFARHVEPRQPLSSGELGGVETGTDLPTVFAPDFDAQRRAFLERYPDFSWSDFVDHATRCFLALQQAWSEREWGRARSFETDHLFQTHRFWIERYRESRLINHCEDVKVESAVPVKIEPDAYFEAVTLRIFASMLDYTMTEEGQLVAGSTRRARTFSEYWTFIRRAGFDPTRGQDLKSCPSCSAPLSLSVTGVCEYCDSKVTTGEFGWVLSTIEQDEAYTG